MYHAKFQSLVKHISTASLSLHGLWALAETTDLDIFFGRTISVIQHYKTILHINSSYICKLLVMASYLYR